VSGMAGRQLRRCMGSTKDADGKFKLPQPDSSIHRSVKGGMKFVSRKVHFDTISLTHRMGATLTMHPPVLQALPRTPGLCCLPEGITGYVWRRNIIFFSRKTRKLSDQVLRRTSAYLEERSCNVDCIPSSSTKVWWCIQ